MSEIVSVCGLCVRLHPTAGPCVQADAARGAVRDAGSAHAGTIPAVEAVRPWVERCHAAEAEGERLREETARQAEDIRAALEEVLRGADCRDLPRDTAPDEARAGRDVLARELSRVQGDVADLARQRDAALAVLRRWQEWFRGGVAVPPRQTENSGDIARAAASLLAAAPAPGKETDRDAPGV